MTHGTQHSAEDPRNADILIWINGALKPRDQATVSVFDSGFVLGDGVWEGFRVVGGQPLFLGAHLDRLYEGAKALMLDIGLDRAHSPTQSSTPSPPAT
jgi:branched-chain amino acid aminotransferase